MKKKIIYFACALLFFTAERCFSSGTTAANFLKIGVGARNIGMGEAAVAVTDDINSVYWNPAGLAHIVQPVFTFAHTQWFQDIQYEQIGFAKQYNTGRDIGGFSKLSLGVNIFRLSVKKFEGRSATDDKIGSVGASDTAFVISGASDLRTFKSFPSKSGSELYGGVNLKYISQQLYTYSASAFALDLGLQWYEASKIVKKGWRAGVNIQNLGTKIKFDEVAGSLPMNTKLGVGYRYILAGDPVTFDMDFNMPNDEDSYVCTGVEYLVKDLLALRVGFRSGVDIGSGIRAGIGINAGLYSIDYAFAGFGDLGGTHRVSLNIKLGKVPSILRLEDKTALIKHHMTRGGKLFEQGRFAEAVLEFNTVLMEEPLNKEAFESMLKANDKLVEMEKMMPTTITEVPKVKDKAAAKTHYLRGIKLYSAGKPEQAILELDNALKMDPKYKLAKKAKEKILEEMRKTK
ncbi:PorV/PorQ family protein [bacterium]|nr:PorV/PorQ family protein [bacterium]MBU3956572.1 PorV/PorQ family protein [bacterium]MBU4134389.1 PorV/PorQ family protein [bacterium]